MIAFYDRTLQVGAAPSDRHAAGGGRHAGAHHRAVLRHPQRILPDSGHRRDSGRFGSGAVGLVSGNVAASSRHWRKVILKDPAVESLSSFIGIDGTNTTLNSGRILINLKPLDERKISASDVIRRLQPELAKVAGITLFMQPVQDLTVEDRVSRTQFQYTLEDPNVDELNTFAPRMLAEAASSCRNCATWPATSRCRDCAPELVFDRDTASRLGITPSTIDQTLYDAYGQRQVSTMFTQLNQYHVVLEVKPDFQTESRWICATFSSAPAAATSTGSTGLVAGGAGNTQLFGPSSSLSAANASLSSSSAASSGERLEQRLRRPDRSPPRQPFPTAAKCRWRRSPTSRR